MCKLFALLRKGLERPEGKKSLLFVSGIKATQGHRWALKNAQKLKTEAMAERLGKEFAHLNNIRESGL